MASRFVLPLADVGNGISPSDGAQLFFTATGTETDKDTFKTEALDPTLKNANPVIANGKGVFPEIWLPDRDRYKVRLKDKNDVQTWEEDPVIGGLSTGNITKNFATVALMKTDKNLIVGDVAFVAEFTAGKGVIDAFYDIVAAGTGTDDGARFHDLDTHQAALRFSEIIVDQWGCLGDGDGAGGGTDDATQLQVCLDYMRDNGTTIVFNGEKNYRSNSLLTMLLISATPVFNFDFQFNGATIDFSGSGLTSGNLLSIGGNTVNEIVETGSFTGNHLKIRGTETGSPPTTATPVGSTVGLNVQFALAVHFTDINARNCWIGYQTLFIFPSQFDHCSTDATFIGTYILGASNDMLWNKFNARSCRFGIVLDETPATNKIVGVTFLAPRVEGADVGVVVDTGTSGVDRIRNLHIYNPYFASIEFDFMRIGFVWDKDAPATRGAARSSPLIGMVLLAGTWIQNVAWNATHVGIANAPSMLRNSDIIFPSKDETNALLNPPLGSIVKFSGTVHGNIETDYKSVWYDNNGIRVVIVDAKTGITTNLVSTFGENDATPDISLGSIFKTANTAPTTIISFDKATIGSSSKVYTVIVNDANTTFDFTGTSLRGNVGVDYAAKLGDHVTVTLDGDTGIFYCDVSKNVV